MHILVGALYGVIAYTYLSRVVGTTQHGGLIYDDSVYEGTWHLTLLARMFSIAIMRVNKLVLLDLG